MTSENIDSTDTNEQNNLHQRMLAITGDCKKTKEDGKVRAGKLNYDFTSHNAVTELIQPLLCKHRVDATPHMKTIERTQFTELNYDKEEVTKYRTTVFFDLYFVNVDDPEDREVVPWFSEAIGNTDKVTGIAISAGIRQCYQKRFKLRTGDADLEDSDNDDKKIGNTFPEKQVNPVNKDGVRLISPKQVGLFNKLAEMYKWGKLDLLTIFSSLGVDKPEEIAFDDFQNVKAQLEKGPDNPRGWQGED